MELRTLGASGLKVSAIGLGGNTFGRSVRGEDAVRVIHRALDLGITFVDTADIYGGSGASEELIGTALQGRRADVVLATKCGNPMDDHPSHRGLSRRWIMQSVEGSLRRLRTDYVDLFQFHVPDADTPLEESLRALDDLVKQGKVRYAGVSNFAAWQMAQGIGISQQHGLVRWISAQNHWNILEGVDDPYLLTAARALGFGVIPYMPLAGGLLTGKYRPGEPPPPGTRLADNPRLRRLLTDEHLAAVGRLQRWAAERGHSTTELGIAWLLAHPEVSTVIVGARTPEQVETNVRALTWTMQPDEREEAARVARAEM